jgi:hypothetical protein
VVLVGELMIPAQQALGWARPAETFDVHDEKGNVGEDVTFAQRCVEREAVEDARPIVEAEYVGGQEVAVPIAAQPRCCALGKEGFAVVEKAHGLLADQVKDLCVDVSSHLVEVVDPPLAFRLWPSKGGGFVVGPELFVECSYGSRHRLELLIEIGAGWPLGASEEAEGALDWHTLHDKYVVDGGASYHNGGDADVDVWGESTVELVLLAKRLCSVLDG